MNTIQEILVQVQTATHPVVKALHKGQNSKVLALAFLKDMVLKEHQTHLPTTLIVLVGKVLYKEVTREILASQYDEIDIPVDVLHQVVALEDSLCLLIQG